jgi:myo-inositol-1(or 4)-monophosphatase
MIITDVELAVAAARAGAAVVAAHDGTAVTRHDKGGGDFATAVDLAAERAILAVLRDARPDDAVTGEEYGADGADGAPRRWLVDPLCGTVNYATGAHLVAVNVALRVGGHVTAAAVADPYSGEVFWTGGSGAWLRRDPADAPLAPTATSRLVEVNLDPPFPNAATFRATDLLAHPDFVASYRPRVLSTTLAAAWVAAGRRAGYVTDGHGPDNVHFAAAVALCRAAGCTVTDLAGRQPRAGGGLVLAADTATHAALLAMITSGSAGSGPGR